MAESRKRTAEEREAARLERERRRAAAALRSGDADADADAAPAPDGDGPGHADPAPAPDGDGHGHADAATAPDGDGHGEWTDGHEWQDEHEIASGTRRVAWRERTAKPRPRARAARRPMRPILRGPRSHARRAGAVVALLLAAALIWFCVELFQPLHGSGHGSVTVTVPAHSGASQVGDLLERNGVIASAFFFKLRAALAGDRGSLRAGTYRLKLDMSYGQVLKVLTTPPPAAKVTDVTIVPGRTRSEISRLLHEEGVSGSYLAATRRSGLLSPTTYGAPRSTSSLEGMLFPDTYQLRDPISISALIANQLETFRKEFGTVSFGYARTKHLTPYDVLIIASMIEAEAQTAHDRPLIASVIYNRLADHMPLQIDATTRYATGNYTSPLTQSQLGSPSPYNTRIHPGLTPTPIDSPGLSSIQAAAHPARTHYLYFVVKPCGNGEHAFASSYTQFLAEVQRYYSARSARGGKSPAKC